MAEELTVIVETSSKKKKEKKERKKEERKKNKKRKKLDDDDDDDNNSDAGQPVAEEIPMDVDNDSSNAKGETVGDDKKPKKKKMKEAKSRLKSKKEEKEELMKKVPLKDEEGIAYTKFQIRQMLKRVKKGLAPVATAKEIEEKRQNEARLRREEEAELAGLATTRNTVDNNKDDTNETKTEDDSDGDNDDDDNDDDDDEKGNENEVSDDDGGAICQRVDGPITGKDDGSAKKKAKRNKPVPSDYVCQACKNRHQPAHWIYDCPDKVTVRGTNKKRKKERGISDPDSKKVFVSGLPFDAKVKAVEDFFAVTKNCGTVAAVRLVKFEDTGRCNGQAYISFDTDDGAQRAIALSGTTIDAAVMSSSSGVKDSKKKKEDETPAKRKELKLKVSKVLNRRKTKRG